MTEDAIPVTIVSGALGAGKTTLVNRILHRTAPDRRVAVLVNDMGELNVDAELIEDGAELVGGTAGVAELSNGCICCELRDDLEVEVMRLARTREFDVLLIETSGISEPESVARLLTTRSGAAARYRVDTVVTVVAADQFLDQFDPTAPVERAPVDGDETRPLSELLTEQIEFASVILLNKGDLVETSSLDRIEDVLSELNPAAAVHRTVHGDVAPALVLETGGFDPERLAASSGWQRALGGPDTVGESGHDGEGHSAMREAQTHHHVHDHDHVPHDGSHGEHDHDHDHDHPSPEERYGVSSFVFRARRPFHPERFEAFLRALPPAVIRAKGRFWVAGRPDVALLLSQAGRVVRVEVAGEWLAARPSVERELYRSNRPDLEWHERWGDREHGLVFIGTDIDEAAIRSELDAALVRDEELEREWSGEDDPFPGAPEDVLEFELSTQQAQ